MHDALRGYFARRGDVRLAFLFGSLARGEAHPGSDADIAVAFAPGITGKGFEHPLYAVAADTPVLVGRRVDVVDLAAVPPNLGYAVAAEGLLLWEAEPGLETDFRASAFDRYFDTAPLRRVRQAYLLEDLLRP